MNSENVKNIKSLLASYNSDTIKKVRKLNFVGIENRDVYNTTAPFKVKQTIYLIGRAELREDELETQSVFFKKENNKWSLIPSASVFNLQDPFICKIKDNLIFGGVEVEQKSPEGKIRFRTNFYKGKDINSLKLFARGPWGMKDIRLTELSDGKIGIFTRPRGRRGGRGKIGFRIIEKLTEIKPRMLSNAEIIPNIFAKGEWGGVNDIHLLKDGSLGVLGHIARFRRDKETKILKKYYYPITFKFNTETKEASGIKILVSRTDLPEGEAKREDLYYIIFPGGIIRKNNQAELYAGVSDTESYKITLTDPFNEYEQEQPD